MIAEASSSRAGMISSGALKLNARVGFPSQGNLRAHDVGVHSSCTLVDET